MKGQFRTNIAQVLVGIFTLNCLFGVFGCGRIKGIFDGDPQPPIANAGKDLEGLVDEVIQLDGTKSHDPDGDKLEYRWEIIHSPDGSSAKLQGPYEAKTFFIPDKAGDYVVSLVVSDENGDSERDIVKITVRESGVPPNPGPTQRPEPPKKIQVINVGDELVSLRWAAATDSSIEAVLVYRSVEGRPAEKIVELPRDATEYTDSEAPNGGLVNYQLTFVNEAGESEKSEPVEAKPNADEELQKVISEFGEAYKKEDLAYMERLLSQDLFQRNRADIIATFADVDHIEWKYIKERVEYPSSKTATAQGKLSRSLNFAGEAIQSSHQEFRQLKFQKSSDGVWKLTEADFDFPQKAVRGGPMATAATGNAVDLKLNIGPNDIVFMGIWTQDAGANMNIQNAKAIGPENKAILLIPVQGKFGAFFNAPETAGNYRIKIQATSFDGEKYDFEHLFTVKPAERIPAAPGKNTISHRGSLPKLIEELCGRLKECY